MLDGMSKGVLLLLEVLGLLLLPQQGLINTPGCHYYPRAVGVVVTSVCCGCCC